MILDCHMHTDYGEGNRADFLDKLKIGGINGGVVISQHPECFKKGWTKPGLGRPAKERLENLMYWTDSNPDLFPFFWMDPLEDDAMEQVDMACKYDVKGFKVICDRYYPEDERAMKIFRKIAAAGKPLMFHSGILWDGQYSAKYNKPSNFEALIDIEGLKFSLAHASWPWCDECIAVYGKILNSYTYESSPSVEMFIDMTPGTPAIYREELITKLYTIGYDIENNLMYGTDCSVNDYNHKWANRWIDRDNSIYNKLNIDSETINKVYYENLRRFVGVSKTKIKHKPLTPTD